MGLIHTPLKKCGFHQSSNEFCNLVSGFESSRSKLISVGRGVDSDYANPAKKQRYGKTNLDHCSGTGGGKGDGKVRVLKGGAATDCPAVFKEAEDHQYTQDCVLEFENISSTSVFIPYGFCWCWVLIQ